VRARSSLSNLQIGELHVIVSEDLRHMRGRRDNEMKDRENRNRLPSAIIRRSQVKHQRAFSSLHHRNLYREANCNAIKINHEGERPKLSQSRVEPKMIEAKGDTGLAGIA